MDAWEVLAANAADTTDAWSALNSQIVGTGGGNTPGTPVAELVFAIDTINHLEGYGGSHELSGEVQTHVLSGSIQIETVTGVIQGTEGEG